jgi:RNA polymerase sigma-70 factor (ECF subfamily)
VRPQPQDLGRLGDVDDAALVEALLREQPGAGRQAWRRFVPLVRATVRRLLGPSRDEEDVVQEVFMRFFTTVKRLREPALVRSWLFGICVRVVRKEIRKKALRSWLRLAPAEELCAWPAIPGDPDAREAVRRFYRVIDGLGGEARSLFVVRYIEGRELADVARVHEMSVSTVQRKLARALARVNAQIARDPLLSDYVSACGFGGLS